MTALIVDTLVFPCTMILVGKKASTDGSVLLAHNNDLPGDIASMLQIVPAAVHAPGTMIQFKNGLQIPQVAETFRMLVMNCWYGFAEGDAKAVNQFNVAVAGGTSLKKDRNPNAREKDPLIPGGVSGYIRYIALQRSRTARECVELIGNMYSQYGISYPSSVGIADLNEVWYIEAGGGKCWAAQRVPDNGYLAAANCYRIGEIEFNDKKNFILPPYLKSYAIEKGLWKPGTDKTSSFNFAEIFGGNSRTDPHRPYYNARRIMRIQALLTPGLTQDPQNVSYPLTLKPGEKISLPILIKVLRDYYQGTPYDISHHMGSDMIERPIATMNTVHTSVIQLNPDLPAEMGAVIWGGLSTALTTPYIPFFLGMDKVPAPFSFASDNPADGSAFRQFNSLKVYLKKGFSYRVQKMVESWEELEQDFFARQADIIKEVPAIPDEGNRRAYLGKVSDSYAQRALATVTLLKQKLTVFPDQKPLRTDAPVQSTAATRSSVVTLAEDQESTAGKYRGRRGDFIFNNADLRNVLLFFPGRISSTSSWTPASAVASPAA